MSRLVTLAVITAGLAAVRPAHADVDPATIAVLVASQEEDPNADLADQGIAAEIGVASGGRVTPGGLRVAGHFLYQLSEHDWFDGTVAFTMGGGGAACFRDRDDHVVCDHGLASGRAIELGAGVRRVFARQNAFRPFARVGVGAALVRFSADNVSGLAFPVYGGAGLRAKVAPSVAIVAEGGLALGFGLFTRGLGAEPQFGIAVTAGAEFELR